MSPSQGWGRSCSSRLTYQSVRSFGYFGFGILDAIGTNTLLMFCQPGMRLYWLIAPDPLPMDFGNALLGFAFVNALYAVVLGIISDFFTAGLLDIGGTAKQ